MFKHILVPTDGSTTSEKAINAAVAFAKETGATITGLYVMPAFHVLTYNTEMLEDTADQFAKDSERHAAKFLSFIENAAKEAGVKCATIRLTSDYPFEAIIQAARENECDLITMASHGRKGMKGFLLGSETQKVLMHSSIPVLVYR